MSVHFDLPFRIGRDGSAVVNEQDSDADIRASVEAILSWRRGYRLDRPDLGIDDPVHRQGGISLDALRDALSDQEPRADALIARDPSLLGVLVDQISIDPQGATS